MAVDVCETEDGVVVIGNRRTLRLLAENDDHPASGIIVGRDLASVFGGERGAHRVLELSEFLDTVGPRSVHLVLDANIRPAATWLLEDAVRARTAGVTTVLATPQFFDGVRLPSFVGRVGLCRSGVEAKGAVGRFDAVAVGAEALPLLEGVSVAKVVLRCDTSAELLAARAAGVTAAHTERPAWFRCTWT